MFDLKIMSHTTLLFDDAVHSVTIDGVDTDYEILSFHMDVLGVMRRGDVIIDNKFRMPIERGMLSMINNKCVMLVEPRKPG